MALSVKPQKPSFLLDRAQVYLIKLPPGLDSSNVVLKVFSKKGLALPPYSFLPGGKKKQSGTFVYTKDSSSYIGGIQLPLCIPSGTWVWFFNYDDHLLIVDDDLYLKITERGGRALPYELPQSFDLLQKNVYSFRDLKNIQLNNSKLLLNQLSVPKFKDTTVEVRYKDSLTMPLFFKDPRFSKFWNELKRDSELKFDLNGYVFMNQLWIPLKKSVRNYSDGCNAVLQNFQLKKHCFDGGFVPTIPNGVKYDRIFIKLVFKK